MSVSAELWQRLCRNAELFSLDMNEFRKLESFFMTLDPEFFVRCAGKVITDFPFKDMEKSISSDDEGKFLFLCIVYNYQNAVEHYRKKGWGDAIFEDIRKDLSLWQPVCLRDSGTLSLSRRIFNWSKSCLSGNVKQFGRLQCNDIHLFYPQLSLYRDADGGVKMLPAFCKDNPAAPDLTWGDRVINLHIPAAGALKEDQCRDSIRRMCRFSQEFHPDYDFKAVVCYSWILDPQFREFLPESSNILKFQKLGFNAVLPGHDETQEVIWRLWGDHGVNMPVKDLPAASSMERGVKEFLLNGGRFDEGLLVIFKDQIDF